MVEPDQVINSQWDNVTVCLDEGCSEEKERRREGGKKERRRKEGERKEGGERRVKFPQLRC